MLEFLLFFACEIAALHVFFVWIDRRWPPRPAVDVSHLDAETRKRMAKRADRLGTGISLLACPAIMAAWGFGFYFLQLRTLPAIPGAVFVRMPTPVMHDLPALFAGIALAGPVGLAAMRIVYRRRFHEVMAVGDAHFRYDVRSWMYATFVWIVPLCVDAESLWLGRYVTFTPEGIHSRGVWSHRDEFRPYRDVAGLFAVDGKKRANNLVLPDRRFLVTFRDGPPSRRPDSRIMTDAPRTSSRCVMPCDDPACRSDGYPISIERRRLPSHGALPCPSSIRPSPTASRSSPS